MLETLSNKHQSTARKLAHARQSRLTGTALQESLMQYLIPSNADQQKAKLLTFKWLCRLGDAWHPDNRLRDLIDMTTGNPAWDTEYDIEMTVLFHLTYGDPTHWCVSVKRWL